MLKLIGMHVLEMSIPSCLEELVLIQMPNLKSCISLDDNLLSSCLLMLCLEECSKLTTCSPLQLSSSEVKKQWSPGRLQKLIIHDCPRVMVSCPLPPTATTSHLSIKGVSTLPKMDISWVILQIGSSDELRMLDENILAFHNLSGIKGLHIRNCPNMISLSFEGFNHLVSLFTLKKRLLP